MLLHRFQVVKCLYRSDEAEIIHVFDSTKQKFAVLKLASDQELARKHCLNEWYIAQQLDSHRHILGISELLHQEQISLLMPLADCNLLEYVTQRSKSLTLKEIGQLIRDIATALEFLHGQRIIHRDLKLENVLLHEGCPKISDFAYAVKITGTTHRDNSNLIVGTVEYMAPEVYTQGVYTTSVDIYALGIMLHELLTGYSAHYDHTVELIRNNIISNQRQYDHLLPDEPSLRDLLNCCIGKTGIVSTPHSRATATEVLQHKFFT